MRGRLKFPLLVCLVVLFSASSFAQAPRYDRSFFIQLRSIFGRFRDSDLERVFDKAEAVECSELVNGDGEWRTVAFFNEDRKLGDWYRSNFDEVKSDLAAFVFTGVCRGAHGPVQLTTRFPVSESVEAYDHERITLDEIAVNTNAPVRASFDSQSQAYAFDLPYLFLVDSRDNQNIYTLNPPTLLDRRRYATDAIEHWDCKSVSAENVTYHFLICRTTTMARDPAERRISRPAFGASAYFILSDGKEASSSVRFSFNDSDNATPAVGEGTAPAPPGDVAPPSTWEAPDPEEKILDIVRDPFRIRFAPQSWTGKIAAPEVLLAKRLTSLATANPADGADYCIWTPGSATVAQFLMDAAPESRVRYDVAARDREGLTPTSITFSISSLDGGHAGTLQCIFPRASSAGTITAERWRAVVGENLVLELMP